MDFSFTEEQKALRKEVSDWLDKELTPEVLEQMEPWQFVRKAIHGVDPLVREFNRKLGKKGWLSLHWPKEYGGEGSVMKQYIVFDEVYYHHGKVWNSSSLGNLSLVIVHHGSEELKGEILPRLAAGEAEIALGYSEPEAGSDLASLQMRAVEDGDDYIINGEKLYTTACHYADYHWIAVRTDPTLPKHKGLSVFIVDMNSPGITIRPLITLAGGRTNEVFYDNVRVPKRRMLGEKNQGWMYIVNALDYERVIAIPLGDHRRLLEELIQYSKETYRKGKPLAKDPLVRQKLAEMAIELEVAYLFDLRSLWMLEKGMTVSTHETAMRKVFVGEFRQRLVKVGMEILGLYGQLKRGSKWAPLEGIFETGYRSNVLHTFGGGASELMRNIIAIRGYGLPRGS